MGLFHGTGDATGVVAGLELKRVGLNVGVANDRRGGPLGMPIATGWLGNICCEPG